MTAKELAAWIKAQGWTQRRTAEYLGVTEGAVSRWVSGERPIPGPVFVALAAVRPAKKGLDTRAKIVAKRPRTGAGTGQAPRKSLRARG